VKGFASGGYTGDIGTTAPAGVVHGREYVVNAAATAANRSVLDAINYGRAQINEHRFMPAYAGGGSSVQQSTVSNYHEGHGHPVPGQPRAGAAAGQAAKRDNLTMARLTGASDGLPVPAERPVEPAPVDPYIACQHLWEAWDGTVWDLSQGLSGLALQSGTRGTEMPDPTFYKTRAAGVHGSLYRGYLIDEQSDFWPLKMFSDGGSAGWVQHYRAFWRTMRYDKTGLWSVVQPDGTKRSKRVRFAGLNDRSNDIDPMLTGWNLYGINLAAEQPFWMGEPSRARSRRRADAAVRALRLWIKSSLHVGVGDDQERGRRACVAGVDGARSVHDGDGRA
jgi:hypothetical protein